MNSANQVKKTIKTSENKKLIYLSRNENNDTFDF